MADQHVPTLYNMSKDEFVQLLDDIEIDTSTYQGKLLQESRAWLLTQDTQDKLTISQLEYKLEHELELNSKLHNQIDGLKKLVLDTESKAQDIYTGISTLLPNIRLIKDRLNED